MLIINRFQKFVILTIKLLSCIEWCMERTSSHLH